MEPGRCNQSWAPLDGNAHSCLLGTILIILVLRMEKLSLLQKIREKANDIVGFENGGRELKAEEYK